MAPEYYNPDNPSVPIVTTDRPHPGDSPPLLPAGYDKHVLAYDQKRILAAMLSEGSLGKAVAVTKGVGMQKVRAWLRTDANFQAAWNELGTGLLTESRAVLDSLLPEAATAFEEAMNAERTVRVDVECPECGHEHTVEVNVADLRLRLQVAEKLFKRSGDLAAKVKVEGEVQHRDMALEDRLALAQVTAWQSSGQQGPCPVPPDVYRSLLTRGLIEHRESPATPQAGATGQGQGPRQADESAVSVALGRELQPMPGVTAEPQPVPPPREGRPNLAGLSASRLANFARTEDSDTLEDTDPRPQVQD